MKRKYNISFGRKLLLPLVWICWLFADRSKRKSWHHVKKSMENHVHRYTIKEYDEYGAHYVCEHEGCYFISQTKSD